jgi:hypothetical protein
VPASAGYWTVQVVIHYAEDEFMKPIKEAGQALIVIALAAIVLFGFVALAIDGSAKFADRRHAQNAADTAVLAGALARINGDNQWKLAALNRAQSNGYNNNLTTNTVTVYSCDENGSNCGSYAGQSDYVKVVILSHVNTYFASVIGFSQTHNSVEALAISKTTFIGGPLYEGASVFATKTGNCNGANASALLMSGSGHLQMWGGDLATASTDPDCLNFKGGQTELKLQESGTECADILSAASSGGTFKNVTGEDGCGNKIYNQTFDSPPEDLGITCNISATKSGSSMTPGNFVGSFPPSGVATLQSGTYCLWGDFKLNGGQKLTGNGVTIVMNNGTLKWNGGSEVNLSAPTSGTYKGLLIYAPPSNSYANGNNEINIDGNANAKITGTVLAQNLPCYFAGTGQIQKATIQFVCYTWGMNGNGQGEIMYDSSQFWHQILPAQVGLLQ